MDYISGDLEIYGRRMLGRTTRKREAPERVRGWGFGRGRPRPPPVRGFGGITPRKFLKFYIAKDAFSCFINGIFAFEN